MMSIDSTVTLILLGGFFFGGKGRTSPTHVTDRPSPFSFAAHSHLAFQCPFSAMLPWYLLSFFFPLTTSPIEALEPDDDAPPYYRSFECTHLGEYGMGPFALPLSARSLPVGASLIPCGTINFGSLSKS